MLKLTKANENAAIRFLDLTITNFGGLETLSDEIKAESEKDPAVCVPLSTLLGLPDDGMPLYVLTTKSKTFGAKAILYPNMINLLAEKFHGKFWIIPSSVHELIVFDEKVLPNCIGLVDMIKEVNRTEVMPEERLSDNAYNYKNGKWYIVRK